jgi:hypothetical protein
MMRPAPSLRLVLPTLAFAFGASACGPGERGEVIFPPGGLALDSAGRRERVLTHDTLSLVRAVGGASERDTTLINPYIMASDGDQVYFVEMDNRIVCFDTLGSRRWTQGKEGGGPGEYRNPRDLKVAPDGRLWVIDPASGRITILARESGKVLSMIPMKVAYSPVITPIRSGFALYPPDMGTDIHYFTPRGDTLGSGSVPWEGFRQIEYLSRQFKTAVDRRTGRWAMGFIYGNGWFAFDTAGRGSERHYYVEPTAFPPVIKQRRENKEITSLVRTPGAALDIQLAGDTVFVLFDGREPDRRRKVDMYGWGSGKYYGSFLLPEPADNIGITGDLLAVFATNPVPKLAFYRRLKKPDRQ